MWLFHEGLKFAADFVRLLVPERTNSSNCGPSSFVEFFCHCVEAGSASLIETTWAISFCPAPSLLTDVSACLLTGGTCAEPGSPSCTHVVVADSVKTIPFDISSKCHVVKSDVSCYRETDEIFEREHFDENWLQTASDA